MVNKLKAQAVLSGIVAVASMARAAAATEYVVSPNGKDNASGLAAAPWQTLQHAIDTVAPGDVVTVEDGSYAGLGCDGISGTAGSSIVFRSRNRWGAKIDRAATGSSQDFVQFSSCSYVTFDGFEVSGAPRSGIAILGNEDDGSDARGVVIRNCYSHDNGGHTATGRHDGIFSGFALDLTLERNRVETTGEHGIYVSNAADNPKIIGNDVSNTGANCIQINADLSTGGDGLISGWLIEGNTLRGCQGAAGVNLDGAIHGVARNNVIFAAAKAGFTLFQGDGAEASHDNVIVNNTVYNAQGSRAAIQLADGADNNVVFNNIFIAKSAAFEVQNVTGAVHDYNIVSSYTGTSAAAHEVMPGDVTRLFADSTGGDLRLVKPGIAVDVGIATLGGAAAPTVDVLGGMRPVGAGYDLGAYEADAVASGGTSSGGASNGGSSSGGKASGGNSNAGNSNGGKASGGSANGSSGATANGGNTSNGGTEPGPAGSGPESGASPTIGAGTSAGARGGTASQGSAGSTHVDSAKNDGGCGCRLSSERSAWVWPELAAALALLFARRLRRR